ncbi:hydroxysqualene dehydroxylase HpnE [Rhizomonospora bruguierae]|uniref:hydroxysqualene dehydroxylase HpnE n=1 Tax=Rhizomonospora bruguierae TaxID=1581705 RepID=UPI001BCD4E5A|nr:hydroxysqualene dehydroxylase HpnE [Micromonospora sp. NBRC 107566]
MSRAGGTDVCVVGGGLAGIAAAVRLADRGARVTMLEARPEFGGAARSLRRGDLVADTGQHVFLRCYHRYRELLDRLGVAGSVELQDRFAVPVLSPGRPPHTLVRGDLPAPLHLLGALTRYRLLSGGERLAAVRAAAALRRVDPDERANDATTFGAWLRSHGQGPRAVRYLWDLIAVASLNLASERASLASAARVFRTGLLERADAGDIGRPTVPLADLHGGAARALLERMGVRVLTRTRARGISAGPGGFTVDTGTAAVSAGGVVLAVPHRIAAHLVPPGAVADPGRWAGLGSSPIVNVHLRYSRPVTDLPFAAAVESPTQWVFDRSGPGCERGQYLVVSLSAADAQVARPAAALVREQAAALADLFPAARSTRLLDAFVTREPHATFRPAPGSRSLRPGPRTALPGLALAGAWTDTGWPDTMEGAVRSGQQAAEVAAHHLSGRPRPPEAPR